MPAFKTRPAVYIKYVQLMVYYYSIPCSGYFSGGGGNFSWIWKILRVRGKNVVVTCTRALMGTARCICGRGGNCFVGKYFVVCFSTTKILPPPPPKIPTRYTVYTVKGEIIAGLNNCVLKIFGFLNINCGLMIANRVFTWYRNCI